MKMWYVNFSENKNQEFLELELELRVDFSLFKLQDFEMPMTQHSPGISEILDQKNQDGTLNTWKCIYWELIIDGIICFQTANVFFLVVNVCC